MKCFHPCSSPGNIRDSILSLVQAQLHLPAWGVINITLWTEQIGTTYGASSWVYD